MPRCRYPVQVPGGARLAVGGIVKDSAHGVPIEARDTGGVNAENGNGCHRQSRGKRRSGVSPCSNTVAAGPTISGSGGQATAGSLSV
jgi:hypothetical protein